MLLISQHIVYMHVNICIIKFFLSFWYLFIDRKPLYFILSDFLDPQFWFLDAFFTNWSRSCWCSHQTILLFLFNHEGLCVCVCVCGVTWLIGDSEVCVPQVCFAVLVVDTSCHSISAAAVWLLGPADNTISPSEASVVTPWRLQEAWHQMRPDNNKTKPACYLTRR